MLDSLLSLVALACITLAAYAFGRLLLVGLAADPEDRLARAVWSVAVGMVAFAAALAALGVAGLLVPASVLMVSAALALAGTVLVARGALWAWQGRTAPEWSLPEPSDQGSTPTTRPPPRWLLRGAAALAGLTCLGALAGALVPPTGPDACAPLQPARMLLADQGFGRSEHDGDLASLRLLDAWHVWAMALDGPVAARLVPWGLGILLALATVVLAGPIVGRRWAWLAGALTLLVPGVHAPMAGSSPSGLALGLFMTLALVAWWRATVARRSPAWLAMAALMIALAMVAGPRGLLAGPSDPPPVGSAGRIQAAAAPYPLGALLPALLPGVLMARRLRGLGTLLGAALLVATWCYVTDADDRLLVPIVPPLAVAAVWVGMEVRRFPAAPRRVTVAGLAALATLVAATAVLRSRPHYAAAFGFDRRSDYLARWEPTWPAADLANQIFPPNASLLSEEPNTLYFNCPVTPEERYRRLSQYDAPGRRPGELARLLREAGFTHLLLVEDLREGEVRENSPLSRLVETPGEAGDRHGLVTLLDYSAQTPDGARRYRLVAVCSAPS